MAQLGSTRSGGHQDERNDFVTAMGSSSSSYGHEGSKYVTASMDEVQIAGAIEKSREQGWSEVADHVREGTAGASWSRVLSEEDQLLWEKLKKEAPDMFVDMGERVKLGRVIAEGGQAHIYEASVDSLEREYVAKVFKMEVADHVREGTAGASWSRVLSEEDQLLWEKLKKEAPNMFVDMGERVKLGRVIAEGGQAHIYEALVDGLKREYVAKVFKMEGFSLAELHHQWPRTTKLPSSDNEIMRNYFSTTTLGGVVFDDVTLKCSILLWGTFLNDGRFAFLIEKYWGDLRTLINLRLSNNNDQGPPFSNDEIFRTMYDIAGGMKDLHERGVLHRDLKAANVLIQVVGGDPRYSGRFHCVVADYESAMLVQGTQLWRAPEVLEDLLKEPCDRNKEIWTEKVDVYGYAMTCYEVLTGHIPFFGYGKSDWKRVIDGERPHLPDYVHPTFRELVERCWRKEPVERPMFDTIVSKLQALRYS